MPARLFCYIKTTFARFNKTVFFGLAALILIIVAVRIADAQTTSPDPLDATYAPYSGLFTGGISNPLVQNSDSNNAATQLTFSLNLTTQPSIDPANPKDPASLKNSWSMLSGMYDANNDYEDYFLIELCSNADTSQCWLSLIPNDVPSSDSSAKNQNATYDTDTSGNYVSTETVAVNAFGKNDTVYTYHPSTQTSYSLSSAVTFPAGSQATASLWYCASGDGAKAAAAYKAENKTAPTPVAGTPTTTPANFGTICGSAFPVGAPITVNIPATAAATQQQIAASTQVLNTASTLSSTDDDNLPKCGIVPGIGNGTINGCGAQLAYLLYQLCAWVAGLFGELFDFFIGYSLSSASYTYPFVVTGWDLVRDISNIFFIIIMVWTGFSAVFDTNTTSMKKVVPNLIINALLINFSLFATRVVIDISNITARVFYNQMVVCKQTNVASNNCNASNGITGTGGYPSLSVKIVSAFNPQDMFKPSVINPPGGSTTDSNQNVAVSAANLTVISNARQIANYFAIISIIAAAIMVFIAIMFFKVAFLFVGRVVGLYICMIFSPFAFLSREIPMLGGIERLRWGDWVKELTSYAMLAPVFVFFLYIIYTFLSSNFVQQIGVQAVAASGFFATVMSIVIPMVIIFFLLQAAQKTAEKLAGEIGRSIQKFGEQATGLAVGVASGGAALVGSRVVGGLAKRVDESRVGVGIRNMAAQGGLTGFVGKSLQRGVNSTRNGSFDVRQSAVGGKLFDTFGLKTDSKALNALAGVGLGLGVDQRKGGREADVKRRQEKEIENEKLLEEKGGDQINAYNKKQKEKYNKKLDTVLEEAMIDKYMTTNNVSRAEAKTAIDTEKNADDKTAYNNRKSEVLKDTATQSAVSAIEPAKQIASAEELNSARRKTYVESLKKGGLLTQSLDWMAKKGETGAQISELLSATVGAAIGSEVRTEGSRKAAKKIAEKSKVDKELTEIETTLKDGFRDLIAKDMFGKSYNDTTMTAAERSVVDARHTVINADENQKTQWSKRVEVVEKAKIPAVKEMSRAVKDKERAYSQAEAAANADPNNAAKKADAQAKFAEYLKQLDETDKANKKRKVWADIAKYQEEQKKKLKDEEKK